MNFIYHPNGEAIARERHLDLPGKWVLCEHRWKSARGDGGHQILATVNRQFTLGITAVLPHLRFHWRLLPRMHGRFWSETDLFRFRPATVSIHAGRALAVTQTRGSNGPLCIEAIPSATCNPVLLSAHTFKKALKCHHLGIQKSSKTYKSPESWCYYMSLPS